MLARRGMFIVVEGLDRSGKSTQAKKLAEALTERAKALNPDAAACLQFNYPNRQSQSGQLLDQYLQRKTGDDMGNEAVHLLFSMNRWENKNWVVQQLASGTNLVCDRYAYSGVAYSVAKGLDFDWCLGADRGLVQPDLVLYFDISAEQAASRSGFGEERFERLEFQQKVEIAYSKFKQGGISHTDFTEASYAPEVPNRWINIALQDATIDEVHQTILSILEKYERTFSQIIDAEQLNNGLFK